MATQTLSPGTTANDATVGTQAWSNPNNAKVSDNAYAEASTGPNDIPIDGTVKIVKNDGTFGTINKAISGVWSTTESYISYGSSSDLWGETWDADKINDPNFGAALSVQLTTFVFSDYLKATNFGFSISAGATINGILVEIERKNYYIYGYYSPNVDHIRITVDYTEVPLPNFAPWVEDTIVNTNWTKSNITGTDFTEQTTGTTDWTETNKNGTDWTKTNKNGTDWEK